MEAKITIAGIGSVMVDAGAGTLQPTTHVVGQRLGVGFGFDDARMIAGLVSPDEEHADHADRDVVQAVARHIARRSAW